MSAHEPAPILPNGPRYSALPLPPYRFVPGHNAHPRRDPAGHSYGRAEATAAPWSPAEWRTLEPYLHGIDLYNRAYWWECHETLEGLWLAAGRTSPHARFVRGIILVAAACLNRHLGKPGGGRRQAAVGMRSLATVLPGPIYMGLPVPELIAGVRACFEDGGDPPPALLRL